MTTKTQQFAHIHTHTTHSILDGVTQVHTLIDVCKQQKITKIAITNHGNVINLPEIIISSKKAGIQVIPGCEFYISWDHSRTKKDNDNKKSYHLIGLAINNRGWKNLMKLSSEGFLSGYYYKPRIDKELLERYHEDIIFTTACLNGVFNSKPLKEEVPIMEMYEDAMWLKQLLGDRLYLEVQRHPGLPAQEEANCNILKLAKKCDIPIVATCDSHYGRKEDFEAWRSIMLLQTQGKFGADAINDYYIKTEKEMKELFHDLPQAITNTMVIADKCEEITFDKSLKFPKIDTGDLSEEEFIRQKTYLSLATKVMVTDPKYNVYVDRLEMEIKVLKDMGFISYMLVVSDFVNAAKAKGIRIGPSRGSGGGTLTGYLLNITTIDPIKYGLIFERFLNPGRADSCPDFDIDIMHTRRDEVKDYMVERHGIDKVASIMTLGTQAAKMAIRDVARVKGVPYSEANQLACALPEGKRGKNIYLRDVTNRDSEEYSSEFMNFVNQKSLYKEVIEIAKVLEGGCKSTGTHAAGVVVSDHLPLIEHTALMLDKNKRIITQNDMKVLEKILGLIKFDFLGLSTLTTIEMTKDFVKELQGIDIDNIPEDDSKTFDLLCNGSIDGVFQLSGSEGFKGVTRKIAPRSIREIADITSLYRPGPLDNGFIPIYTRAKETGIIEYMVKVTPPSINKQIEAMLVDTNGCVIYQEQIISLVKILANYTLAEADNFRRILGKKIELEMKQQREKFVEGCKKNKISKDEAEHVFDTIEKFSSYSFNLSHAVGYSVITYQTAYLKANYHKEFMAAILNEYIGDDEKLIPLIQDCRETGLKILPPDVNESNMIFKPTQEGIRFGFSAIKGFGEIGAAFLVKERTKNGNFRSFTDFISRVDLSKINKTKIAALVNCGCFDKLNIHGNRKEILANLSLLIELAKSKNALYFLDKLPDYTEEEKCKMEYHQLGFFISGHPLDKDKLKLSAYCPISELKQMEANSSVSIGGIVTSKTEIRTKKGQLMGKFKIEDLRGNIEVILFPNIYSQFSALIEEGNKIVLSGKISIDTTREMSSVQVIGSIVQLLDETEAKSHLLIHIDDMTDLEGIKNCLNKDNMGKKVYLKYRNVTFPLRERFLPTSALVDTIKSYGGMPQL